MALNEHYTTELRGGAYWPPREIRTRRTRMQRLARSLTPFGWCCVGLVAFWSALALAVFA